MACAFTCGESAIVLQAEANKEVDLPVGHIHDLLNGLYDMEEAPWAELSGRPLDARGIARILRPYEIKPTTVRMGSTTAKGYYRDDLWDAWQRYLT